MSKGKEPEKNREQNKATDEILELIQWIDDNNKNKSKPLFLESDIFEGWTRQIMAVFLLIAIVTFFTVLNVLTLSDLIVILVALFTVIIAVLSLMAQIAERDILETRFQRALKKRAFNDSQKLILKALIKIRSQHLEFALKDVYDMNKEMFTEKRLLEKLYE